MGDGGQVCVQYSGGVVSKGRRFGIVHNNNTRIGGKTLYNESEYMGR